MKLYVPAVLLECRLHQKKWHGLHTQKNYIPAVKKIKSKVANGKRTAKNGKREKLQRSNDVSNDLS